ncbi:MAG TPA: M42 family metallopeptidase [Candidatus Merdenecus merdavium]|nr:M42 family metallopeptidase [Candidatus Merdenecus merdavium]
MKQQVDDIIRIFGELANIPSPTGYTHQAIAYVEDMVKNLGYPFSKNQKGGFIIEVPGATKECLGLSAHIDTLGAMVRSITPRGTLTLVPVGGFMMESIEGAYCQLHTRTGKTFTGTILTTMPSVHTYDDSRTQERIPKNMEIRIDEEVRNKEDVMALDISPGDFISFDPCFSYTKSGFIKSRHIDDKASVAILLGLLKEMKEKSFVPYKSLKIVISNYEEVGHGSSYLPHDITEFLAIDMGAIGDDLSGDEYKVSICALDSSGPYDYDMTNKLIAIAKEKNLDYAVDIFPHYGSDVSAALRGGNNMKGALIGQGVHASHGMERTHRKGIENTYELLKGYIGF